MVTLRLLQPERGLHNREDLRIVHQPADLLRTRSSPEQEQRRGDQDLSGTNFPCRPLILADPYLDAGKISPVQAADDRSDDNIGILRFAVDQPKGSCHSFNLPVAPFRPNKNLLRDVWRSCRLGS